MDKHSLNADQRELLGRKVKTLRTQGILPANIFGKDIKSKAIKVDRSEFTKVFADAGETGIIDLQLDKESVPVLVTNLQTHPVTKEPLHVDFRQVNMKEKIEAQVPVELVGESQAEKDGLGIVVQQTDEVTVEALPMDLPEKFEADISILTEAGQSITVADLKAGDKVTILDEAEKVIAMVEEPQAEEVVAPVATEGETVEGEAPAAAEGEEEVKPEGENTSEEESK